MELSNLTNTPVRLLPLPVVENLVGYRKSKLYNLLKQGTFPQPVRVGRSIKFVESEVLGWIQARIAERDAMVGVDRVLVDEKTAAAALGVSVSFLQKDRLKPEPRVPFERLGPHIRYDVDRAKAALKGGQS